MKIRSSYDVSVAPERVFDYLIDPTKYGTTTYGRRATIRMLPAEETGGRPGYALSVPKAPELGTQYRIITEMDRPVFVEIETWREGTTRRSRVRIRLQPIEGGTRLIEETTLAPSIQNALTALIWPIYGRLGTHRRFTDLRARSIEQWATATEDRTRDIAQR